ncbi:MAG: DUF1800 domain-containing protein [Bacteroidota bacterium]|nr:DUF1800 domain-containing protein [Bacteroidota bacterium]MDP4231890.1 DUF1800 domain-containing protein [Bacteroidota bacterium]MDP4241403.1 DUF1800 domain-containing protein [Bacteroidota bacterium]MDP4287326.1 DUF1800 domain-containing protein [Bacteroidota bacterium]
MERRTLLKAGGAAASLIGAGSIFETLEPSGAVAARRTDRAWYRMRSNLTPLDAPLQTESNDLTPYTGPWSDELLHHLLRRSMFGVPPAQFAEAKSLGTMSAVLDRLLAAADLGSVPLPPDPAAWVWDLTPPSPKDPNYQVEATNFNRLHGNRINQIANWWFDLIVKEDLSLREKLTLLWTNHFVTGSLTVQLAPYMYSYLQTCRQYALGNFKTFAHAIAINPAMLVYLNGDQNFVENGTPHINENFARELMELFTLGILDPKTAQPNYTETDVQNAARALAGWKEGKTAPYTGVLWDGTNGNPDRRDTGVKTFLGQTGNWGLQDVLNIIFEQGTPQGYNAAYFVCQKLYQAFVYYVPNPSVIDTMATVMLANNFEIAPVMRALLSSAHFYDVNTIGAQLKSPAEFFGSLVRELALSYPAFNAADPPVTGTDTQGYNTYGDPNPTLSVITSIMSGQGQQLLNPPNVKGWPGGHNWISTGTFQNREIYSLGIVNNALVNAKKNWNLAFDADRYASQIANAQSLPSAALSQSLEAASLAFTLGPNEGGDLDIDIQGTYPNPNYQYNTLGAKNFAVLMTNLPEFQLY